MRVFYPPGIVLVLRPPGGGGGAFGLRTPSGITPVPGALPRGLSYSNTSGAIFFVWRPERWENWMFEVEEYDRQETGVGWGGMQCGVPKATTCMPDARVRGAPEPGRVGCGCG